ncbi:HEAT repeat domain-containing protein [Thermomonospora cellulosilytica]|uniref:HEAT repeat protein n=1 Tax=Thermomonospora cellulosilytica TaxID=1411118 RepID=A0A7W3N554_9ACTN|nr:HEAT repeat domain-containing protein [Thermomonospora cellulosilytica]MBA9007690.1 HEAT repeat protein [Thermomonospora cellulosilytica]
MNGIEQVSGDPLAGLDDIDWAGLQHAYGSAEDVPGQLRALRSPDEKVREKARWELYGNIFHQGSRYEATPHAVPFLIRMARDPGTPEREGCVMLLSAIAIGYDEAWLPRGADPGRWREEVERLQATDPEQVRRDLEAWVQEAADENERRSREFRLTIHDHEANVRAAVWELACYDAVRAGVPELTGLLEDEDPRVRATTAYLLGFFPEEAPRTLPGLLRAARTDPHAIVSAGLVGDASCAERLRPYLGDEDPLRRCAAALALARLGAADEAVIGELAAVAAEPPGAQDDGEESGAPFLFMEGDLRGYAAATLAALDGEVGARAAEAMIEGLARTSQTGSFNTAAAVLQLVFGEPRQPLPPLEELTDLQRKAVRTLAEMGPETWRWGNFMGILRAWGLPSDRAELRAYARVPSED